MKTQQDDQTTKEDQEISWTSELDLVSQSELDPWQSKKLSDLLTYVNQTKDQYGRGSGSRRFFLVTCTDSDGYHVRHPTVETGVVGVHSEEVFIEIHYVEMVQGGSEVRISPLYKINTSLPSANTLRFCRLLHVLETSFGLPIYCNDSESVLRIFAVHAPILECSLGIGKNISLAGLEGKMVRTATISLDERNSRNCQVLFDSLFGPVDPKPYLQMYRRSVFNNRVTPIDMKTDGYDRNGTSNMQPCFIPLLNELSDFVVEPQSRELCRVACIRLILLQDSGA